MAWKDLLATASNEQTITRAKSCLGKKTKYILGKGGMDAEKPFTASCDCSGFIAWSIGIPRQLPPKTGRWLSTDQYWAGGRPIADGLFDIVPMADALPGDLWVYPDSGGSEGHIGLISRIGSGRPTHVIHCSSGNSRRGDAVQETGVEVFSRHPKSRIVRPDYASLRTLFGVQAADGMPQPAQPSAPEKKLPRLILAKPSGDPADPHHYKSFPEAVFIKDHFEIAPSVVGAWAGIVSSDKKSKPIREVMKALGLDYSVNAERQRDSEDPKVYVFIQPSSQPAAPASALDTLEHRLLAQDPNLQNIASGGPALKATGALVLGAGPVQQALNHLAQAYTDLHIDLGTNDRLIGFFGSRTEAALKAFQKSHGLKESGQIDRDTVCALDEALLSFDANGMVDKTRKKEAAKPVDLGDFRQVFIHNAVAPAVAAMKATGVPASITIAQAILESGWGRSGLSTKAHNYFGIKGKGPAGSVKMPTKEFVNGKWITVDEPFRKYASMEQSFVDHGELIAKKPVYKKAMEAKNDARLFAQRLQGVYATDPEYASKLIKLIDRYDLDEYDKM